MRGRSGKQLRGADNRLTDMNAVAIFLKYPTPGKVKTRMAKDLGDVRAARIYSAMAKKVIGAVGKKHAIFIFHDPPSMREETAKWLGGFSGALVPQRGDSLGEKISNAVDDCVSAGSEKVVVIGTDCVEITESIITGSFESLDKADAVIGPCRDGGYYLIGMKRNHAEIFRDIEWSTDKVTAQTLEKMRKLSLKVDILQTLRDIDFADGLSDGFLREIENSQNPADPWAEQ